MKGERWGVGQWEPHLCGERTRWPGFGEATWHGQHGLCRRAREGERQQTLMAREAAIHPRREAPGAEDTDLPVHSQSLPRDHTAYVASSFGDYCKKGTLSKVLPGRACDWTF